MKKDLSLNSVFLNLLVYLFLAGLLSGLILQPLQAQTTGNIEGTAIDGSRPEYITNATVQLVGTSLSTTTNGVGYFTFRNIDPGTYDLRLTIPGSISAMAYNVVVEAGITTVRNIIVNYNPFHVYFTDDTGTGTLRQAIMNANGHAGSDQIEFRIPGNQTYTITPETPLPEITDPVIIDGFTQAGAYPADPNRDASIKIAIDGRLVSHHDGLGINESTGSCAIRGLHITGFTNAVVIEGTLNTIQGCWLLYNHGTGLLIRGVDNLIGGPAPNFRNVISGNTTGIAIAPGANENDILGNYIGTDISGQNQLRNHESGIRIGSHDNQIGGPKEQEGNIISGNLAAGVLIHRWDGSTDIPERNKIYNNWIGTGADRIVRIPNYEGVQILEGKDNILKGNKILYNTSSGISISGAEATGNRITQNSIFANGELGVDLNKDGVTDNDPDDSDTGPNNLQNYPVLESVNRQNNLCLINGFLRTFPQAVFDIEFYYSDEADGSNHGEGQNFLGTYQVQSNDFGMIEFTTGFGTIPPDGVYFSAIAIDSADNSSEFSESIQWCVTQEPQIDIAYPLFVNRGQDVVLDASGSFDCQDSPGELAYLWQQIPTAGNPFVSDVVLTNATTAVATFTAPPIVESLTFSLRITDTDGNTAEDQIIITILENTGQAVFVSAYLGTDENPGTREKPVGTLHRALEIASSREPNADIYAGAMIDYSEREQPLLVEDNTSIYGGFDLRYHSERGYQWVRTIKRSRILGAPVTLSLKDISHPTTIDQLQIEAAHAAAAEEGEPGGNSIGMNVINATNRLHITNNIILAGKGSDGSHGMDGMSGADGTDGMKGEVYGGDGGEHSFGRRGGSGGDGGLADYLPILQNPANLGDFAKNFNLADLMEAGDGKPGEDGAAGSTGRGGTGGDARHFVNLIYPPPTCQIPLPTLMIDGNNDGSSGQNGQNGAPGEGGEGGAAIGDIQNVRWIAGQGMPGTEGEPGYGGGGGGGGTAYSEMVEVAVGGISFCINKIYLPFTAFGGGGGGGGAGGYGGEGGTGGFGGGASFGIFLYQSEPLIAYNRIGTGNGGEGGWGRRGGFGGSGGSGGEGYEYTIGPINMVDMSETILELLASNAGNGAVGGRGGMGGTGGHGGGGGGGASCGIYIYNTNGTQPVLISNTFSDQTTSILGSPGIGGRPNGQNGIAGPICPPPGLLPVQNVPVVVLPGETETINSDIPSDVSGAVFSHVWSGSDIIMTLITPSGRVIDRQAADPDVEHESGSDFEYYAIKNPESGNWKIDLLGSDVPAAGEETIVNVEFARKNQSPVAMSKDVECVADEKGTAYASVDSGSYDPDCCDMVSITQTPAGPYHCGQTTVILRIEDHYGAWDTDTASVTVVDQTAPVISCEAEYIVPAGSSCETSVPIGISITDNCDPEPQVMLDAPDSYPVGTTFVRINAVDSSGNQSFRYCRVTVVEDEPPHIRAALVSAPYKPDARDYYVQYSVDDNCDDDLPASAVIPVSLPDDLSDWKLQFKEQKNFKIKVQNEEKRIELGCPDPDNLWHYLRDMGGIPVLNGQRVNIVPVSDKRSNRMYEYKHDGTLMIKDPEPALVVRALDRSGNSAIVVAGPDGEIYRDSTRINLPPDTLINGLEDDHEADRDNYDSGYLPDHFIVSQNYPNPFNPVTHIHFSLPSAEFVTLKVYDIRGIEVKTLVSEKLSAGEYQYTFDGRDMASGLYYYEIVVGENRRARKMVLLK